MKRARKLACRVCSKDLTAVSTVVDSALRKGAKTTALRAPPRVELTFTFGGVFDPPRANFSIALCASCAERVTYTATGVSFVIEENRHPLTAIPHKKGDDDGES